MRNETREIERKEKKRVRGKKDIARVSERESTREREREKDLLRACCAQIDSHPRFCNYSDSRSKTAPPTTYLREPRKMHEKTFSHMKTGFMNMW